METINIRRCTVAEIEGAPNCPNVLAEYARESSIDGLGEPAAQFDAYYRMEAAGFLHFIGAFHGDTLAGFLVMVVSMLPHYGRVAASTESYFVAGAYRKTGAGIRLLREAEQVAKGLGAVGFLVSAPSGGRLEKVMPGLGYRETNRVFFRELK